MNPKRYRPAGTDDPWISARQAFVGTCWAALFVACALGQVVGPLLS